MKAGDPPTLIDSPLYTSPLNALHDDHKGHDPTDIPEIRSRTGVTARLRAIKLDGHADFDEDTQRNVSSLCSSLGKRTGWKFTQRRIVVDGVEVVRVWRTK